LSEKFQLPIKLFSIYFLVKYSFNNSSLKIPLETNLKDFTYTPSSLSHLDEGGILPGEIPPISA
jgi:hypothetical protein